MGTCTAGSAAVVYDNVAARVNGVLELPSVTIKYPVQVAESMDGLYTARVVVSTVVGVLSAVIEACSLCTDEIWAQGGHGNGEGSTQPQDAMGFGRVYEGVPDIISNSLTDNTHGKPCRPIPCNICLGSTFTNLADSKPRVCKPTPPPVTTQPGKKSSRVFDTPTNSCCPRWRRQI